MAEKKYLDRDGLSTVLTKIGERFSNKTHTHTSDDITTVVPISKGGTGKTTRGEANLALHAIELPSESNGERWYDQGLGAIALNNSVGIVSFPFTFPLDGYDTDVKAAFQQYAYVGYDTSIRRYLILSNYKIVTEGDDDNTRNIFSSGLVFTSDMCREVIDHSSQDIDVPICFLSPLDHNSGDTKKSLFMSFDSDNFQTLDSGAVSLKDKGITSAKLADGVIPTTLPSPCVLTVQDYGDDWRNGGFSYDGSERIDVELYEGSGISIACGKAGSGSGLDESYRITIGGKKATEGFLGMVKAIPWSSFASSGDNKDQGVYIDEDGTLRCALASDTNDGLLSKADYQYFEHKAGINSPTFTGTPRSNALLNGTENDSQLATTQFVHDAIYYDTVTRAIQAHGSSATQALSSTAITKVPLTTADFTYDTTSFSITDGGIKCLKDGYVEVCGSIYLNNSATSASYGCYIKLDSTEVLSSTHVAWDAHSGSTSTATKLIKVTAGQTFTLNARGASGGTVYPANVATFLYVKYVNYATSGIA